MFIDVAELIVGLKGHTHVPLNSLVKRLIVFQPHEAIKGEPVDTNYGLPSKSLRLT